MWYLRGTCLPSAKYLILGRATLGIPTRWNQPPTCTWFLIIKKKITFSIPYKRTRHDQKWIGPSRKDRFESNTPSRSEEKNRIGSNSSPLSSTYVLLEHYYSEEKENNRQIWNSGHLTNRCVCVSYRNQTIQLDSIPDLLCEFSTLQSIYRERWRWGGGAHSDKSNKT